MLKDYPATYLFFSSLVILASLIFLKPLIGEWHFFLAGVMEILTFVFKVVCAILLFSTVVECIGHIRFHRLHH